VRPYVIAALAATALAVPAHAYESPVCTVHLVNGARDIPAFCETHNIGDTANASGGFYRTVTVEVAMGAVEATLHCYDAYGRSWLGSDYVAGPGVTTFGTWDDDTCELGLRATVDGTTATATSTVSWVFNPA